MTLTAKQALTAMTTSVIGVKKGRCLREGGPTDLAPMLHVFYEDGSQRVTLLLTDREEIPKAVENMRYEHRAVTCQAQREAYVAMIADAYHREREPGADVDEALNSRGEVTRHFAEGDMSVSEMLVVSMLDVAADRMHEVHVKYGHRDNGQPRFAKPEQFDEGDGVSMMGRIPELLREAVA